MTSGIDGVGGSYDEDDQGRKDANALVAPQAPFFAPGTKYQYWDEATQHYGFVLTQIAGESLEALLHRRILDPIGVRHFVWHQDTTGKVLNWTGGIEISAEDLARFGLLFLNGGAWNGRQLIAASWVDEATRVQVPAVLGNGTRPVRGLERVSMVTIGGPTECWPVASESGLMRRSVRTCAVATTTTTCSSCRRGTW